MGTIGIITATFNVSGHLPELIKSLQTQTDNDFEWIVADGGSSDRTVDILKDIKDLNVIIDSRADFGIYDALNRGIKISQSEYYLVLGADDVLYPDAIEKFKQSIHANTQIIAASIKMGDRIINPGRGKSQIYGQFEYVAGHSVGTLFKKDLHEQFGYYSSKFPIAADQLFIKNCCQGGVNVSSADFVAGEFSEKGISSNDIAGNLSEFFRVQLLTEKNKYMQIALFIARLLKNMGKL